MCCNNVAKKSDYLHTLFPLQFPVHYYYYYYTFINDKRSIFTFITWEDITKSEWNGYFACCPKSLDKSLFWLASLQNALSAFIMIFASEFGVQICTQACIAIIKYVAISVVLSNLCKILTTLNLMALLLLRTKIALSPWISQMCHFSLAHS